MSHESLTHFFSEPCLSNKINYLIVFPYEKLWVLYSYLFGNKILQQNKVYDDVMALIFEENKANFCIQLVQLIAKKGKYRIKLLFIYDNLSYHAH